jgi:hypothetical protein
VGALAETVRAPRRASWRTYGDPGDLDRGGTRHTPGLRRQPVRVDRCLEPPVSAGQPVGFRDTHGGRRDRGSVRLHPAGRGLGVGEPVGRRSDPPCRASGEGRALGGAPRAIIVHNLHDWSHCEGYYSTVATTAPCRTTSPSATLKRTVPVEEDSTSAEVLSTCTSHRRSPSATASPSWTNQVAKTPSASGSLSLTVTPARESAGRPVPRPAPQLRDADARGR